jgi:P4 family phage/plasmid primase-like protien
MTSFHAVANSPRPDPEMISRFLDVTLASLQGWMAVRAFPEKGAPDHAPRLTFHPLADDADQLLRGDAEIAARQGLATFVVPGSVKSAGSAKADDVTAIRTIIVDLDHGAIEEKRDHLVRHLGHPSLGVASGGVTGDGEERLHLYWSLAAPALGTEVARVCELRHLVALKVGGDPAFRSAHQPIRLPGSVYRKGGVERIVTVLADPGTLYNLDELEARAHAMPALGAVQDIATTSKPAVRELLVGRFREGGQDGVTRFDALSAVIGYWIRRHFDGHLSWDAAVQEIADYNQSTIVPPWAVDRLLGEIERLRQLHLASRAARATLIRDAQGDVVALPNSQDGLAVAFSETHAEWWRYVTPWGQWLWWNGSRWERDRKQRVRHEIRLVCREQAAEREKPGLASASMVSAVEALAKADPRHAADPDGWDRDPWTLNTPDGLLDLKTGVTAAPTPATSVTKITAATPAGACPRWNEFLTTIAGGDETLVGYLRRVAGYCLTGVTMEHALFFLYGTGANGKSVFINALSSVLGDYATIAPIEMLMSSQGDRHPTELAKLRGARLVTAIETEHGRRWAESKLKTLTGGDRITARFMNRDFFDFTPHFKLMVAGNHRPSIQNVDEALRRRLHLIPFTVTIPTDQRDPQLAEKLMCEAPGILAWAVQGCLEWQRDGLTPPDAVRLATDEYFHAEDAIGRWLEECCERNPQRRETSSALFKAWRRWCEENGEFDGSTKNFSTSLSNRGFTPFRSGKARGYRGLALLGRPSEDRP